MADSLRLLFELDVDSRSGVAGLLRWRKEITATVDAARRAISQPLILPPVKTSATGGRGGQADAHVKEFRRIEAEQKRSTQAQEREQRRLNSAVQSLQRQRSAALIRAFKEEERAAVASARAQERAAQQASRSIANAFRGIGPGLQSLGRTLTVGITAPLLALSAASLKSAKDLDANVNTLKAFTGSAEAAERRLAQLIKTARGTPGLTTNLALVLDAQLRVAQTTQETIDRVLPAIGRLNAVSKLPDAARFTNNLLQLVTQNFERQDLKELVGQSPLAGQLLTQIFNVDSPTNAAAIRASAQKLGITTVDAFFAAFADAAAKNQGLATVTESIATRFEKIVDRVSVALRPLGLAIINAIEPFIEPVSRLIERIGEAFNSLSAPVKTAIVVIGGIVAAAGPVLFILGGLATAITGVVTAIGTISAAVAAVGLPVIALAIAGIVVVIGEWVAILTALGLAWKTNFLNIQGLVSDAASAVVESFTRIKAILTEAIERILPTLQSITTKVLGIVTAAWNKYGRDVVAVLGTAFRFISRIVEDTLETFGNFVDLIAKLIDGDFRGAWAAFARIHITALQAFDDFLNNLIPLVARAFVRLHVIILHEGARLVVASQVLAAKFIVALTRALIRADKVVRDALIEMFVNAVTGTDLATVGAIAAAKFLDAFKKAAARPVQFEDVGEFAVAGSVPAALPVQKRTTSTRIDTRADKGADAATRRRIRLLELEAERAEAIAQQRIAAENIFFEQRRTSLKEFTDFQIKEEEIVLAKKRAVFAAEQVEAEKLTKGRDLALGQIRLKELQAELDFATKRNQLFANQESEEVESARQHRQALLDIQDEGDKKQLELVDAYVERLLISYEEAETRRLEIEDDARRRRRDELELQLGEAGQNVEEQQRIKDAIAKLDAESATAREEAENRKRAAIRATIEAENDYFQTLQDVTLRIAQLLRAAADIELGGLIRRFGDRRKFRLEALRLEREANEEEHQERLRQISEEQQDAEKRLEGVRDAEEKLLQLRRFYADLEKAERERRATERQEEEAEEQRTRDPFSSLRERFENFRFDMENTGAAINDSLQAIAEQVNSSIGVMVDAFGQAIAANILYGESIGKALKAALAQQLAAISAEAAIQALKHAAYAIGNLAFGNFASAAKHAQAAAMFGALAIAAGIAGRALSRSTGLFDRGKSSGTASAGVSGAQPQNREFQYGGQVVESSSTASREGSAAPRAGIGGAILGLVEQVKKVAQDNAVMNAKLDGTLSRIGSLPAGEVVTIGAKDASLAIGAAVIQHQKENNDFSRDMATNMGIT